jgi:hypothetical protein
MRGAILRCEDGDGQVCLHTCLFKGARWDKEEMESFLKILNRNEDWEIRYEIVPKTKAG